MAGQGPSAGKEMNALFKKIASHQHGQAALQPEHPQSVLGSSAILLTMKGTCVPVLI